MRSQADPTALADTPGALAEHIRLPVKLPAGAAAYDLIAASDELRDAVETWLFEREWRPASRAARAACENALVADGARDLPSEESWAWGDADGEVRIPLARSTTLDAAETHRVLCALDAVRAGVNRDAGAAGGYRIGAPVVPGAPRLALDPLLCTDDALYVVERRRPGHALAAQPLSGVDDAPSALAALSPLDQARAEWAALTGRSACELCAARFGFDARALEAARAAWAHLDAPSGRDPAGGDGLERGAVAALRRERTTRTAGAKRAVGPLAAWLRERGVVLRDAALIDLVLNRATPGGRVSPRWAFYLVTLPARSSGAQNYYYDVTTASLADIAARFADDPMYREGFLLAAGPDAPRIEVRAYVPGRAITRVDVLPWARARVPGEAEFVFGTGHGGFDAATVARWVEWRTRTSTGDANDGGGPRFTVTIDDDAPGIPALAGPLLPAGRSVRVALPPHDLLVLPHGASFIY